MHRNFFIRQPGIFLLFLTGFGTVSAQNVTSPYSVLGIGDADTKDFGRYFASGNASLARRDATSYNFSNPASLTELPFKTMNFDIAMRGRSSRFRSPGLDTTTAATKDYVVKRISGAFKVSEKAAFAMGLRPFSSVNYKYNTDKIILDGSSAYTKKIEGSGSINQVYFSYAHSINKRLSVGITGSYLFGAINRATEYQGSTLDLAISKKQNDYYTGAVLQAGLQCYTQPGKKWQHLVGITASTGSQLRGELVTEYIDNSIVIKKETDTKRTFKMPVTIGLGYTATARQGLSISAEANYYNWPYQKVSYSRSYTNPAMRFSTGIEYSKKITAFDRYSGSTTRTLEKWYLASGVSAENSYIRIKDNYLWDYSVSFGGGYHISRGVSFYSGLEMGKKGSLSNDQIRESYSQFIIGVTLKDLWIGPKYNKRYY
jgi:hypothetical protein